VKQSLYSPVVNLREKSRLIFQRLISVYFLALLCVYGEKFADREAEREELQPTRNATAGLDREIVNMAKIYSESPLLRCTTRTKKACIRP
jgi:hypothetical protein